jgi:hypothetical protein
MNRISSFGKRKPLASGTEQGIDWTVYEGPTKSINGYVKLPEDHPWLSSDLEDNESIDVHGGITYPPDAENWIGFDTNHADDELINPRTGEIFIHGVHWTLDMVIAETKKLAKQAAEVLEFCNGHRH